VAANEKAPPFPAGLLVRSKRYYFAGAVSPVAAGALLEAPLLLCEPLLWELLLWELLLWVLCELLCELLLWVAGVAAGAGSSAAKAGAAITARAMTGTSFLNIDVVSSENTTTGGKHRTDT
jgi:hypothetical protein